MEKASLQSTLWAIIILRGIYSLKEQVLRENIRRLRKQQRIWKEDCEGADQSQETKEKHFTEADSGVVLIRW